MKEAQAGSWRKTEPPDCACRGQWEPGRPTKQYVWEVYIGETSLGWGAEHGFRRPPGRIGDSLFHMHAGPERGDVKLALLALVAVHTVLS